MKDKQNKEPKKPKGRACISILRLLLFLFLIGIAVFFLGVIYQTEEKEHKDQKQYEELQKEKHKKGVTKLQKKYKNMVGWLEIKETDFSYPVMQTVSDPEYYLHRDVHDNYSFYGTPFLDYRCNINSDNQIIYGHNINGRRFFGFLQNYRDSSFYRQHPKISFTKVNDIEETYEIISVIKTDIYSDYYKFTDTDNDEEYRDYVQKIINHSLYSCEIKDLVEKEMKENTVEAFFHQYQFLTLSTCRTGEGKDARLLVIGCKKNKKMKEELVR